MSHKTLHPFVLLNTRLPSHFLQIPRPLLCPPTSNHQPQPACSPTPHALAGLATKQIFQPRTFINYHPTAETLRAQRKIDGAYAVASLKHKNAYNCNLSLTCDEMERCYLAPSIVKDEHRLALARAGISVSLPPPPQPSGIVVGAPQEQAPVID